MHSAPLVQWPPLNGRPAALVVCAAVAVALNVGAIGFASGAASPWADHDTRTAAATTVRSSVQLVAVAEPDPTPPAAGIAGPAEPTSRATDTTPRRRPARLLPAARVAVSEPDAEQTHDVLFYSYHEVDDPAFPETDWNLDVDALDQLGVQRLVFEVLVSDRGDVVGCTVLDPSNLADDVRHALEKRLSDTPVLPALRAGQLVASVRRIELVVASTPPEPPARRP